MANITINSLPTAVSIDGVQDIIPIYTNSATATQGINRNTLLGLASAPVGLTDTQTLTNKVLTSPTINGATLSGTLSGTYTIGGTPTFPSSVVTTTGVQTLTNKTLTSPTINSPTITNATLSSDAITGYTTSNSGTIYGGISVTTGNVSMSGTLAVTGTLSSGAITSSGIIKASSSNPVWQYLNSAQITGAFTTTATAGSPAYITGLSVNVIVPSGVTAIRVIISGRDFYNSTGSDYTTIAIYSGASAGALTTQLASTQTQNASTGGSSAPLSLISVVKNPSAGSIYYSAGMFVNASTGNLDVASTYPAFILVECC